MCVPLRRIHQPVETFHYRCNFCPKRFPHVSLLNIHERVHTGEKPYQCMDCGQCFGSQSSLIKHNRSVRSADLLIARIRVETPTSAWTADNASAPSPPSSSSTGQLVGQLTPSAFESGEKPYLCMDCRQCFGSQSSLIKHNRSVSWSADPPRFRIRGETLPVHGLRTVLRLPVLPHQAQQVSQIWNPPDRDPHESGILLQIRNKISNYNLFLNFRGKLSLLQYRYHSYICNSSSTASCYLHRFCSVEGLLWGLEPRFELGPVLQQSDALLFVPRRTLN
jgi:hypothetical protein